MPHACATLLLCALAASHTSHTHGWNVSDRCWTHTSHFLYELRNNPPSQYAVNMYDAFGKLGSDVAGGNVNRPGSPRECVSVRTPQFNGKYCQVFLKQEPVQYFVGICVPDSCDDMEVQTLVVYDVFQQGGSSLLPPIPPLLLDDSTQSVLMTQCHTQHAAPDTSAIFCLFVCSVFIVLPLAATFYMALIGWRSRKEVKPEVDSALISHSKQYGTLLANGSPNQNRELCAPQDTQLTQNTITNTEKDEVKKSGVWWCVQALCVQWGGVGWERQRGAGGCSYSSLDGIRVLSLLWIISGHTTHFSAWNNMDNKQRWKETVEGNPVYVYSFSGPVYLAVDTFLLLGGLLSATSLLSSIQQSDNNLSFSLVANFLLKRFKRVQPLHLFTVCLIVGPLSLLPSGPYWFVAEDEILNCKKYWWSNLLLINNLFTVTNICAPWTWYLSIDLQFYLTTPALILLYRLNKGVMVGMAICLMAFTSLTSALITAYLHLPVHQPTTLEYESYYQHYYNKPYTRYGPYVVGVLAGTYMTTRTGTLLKQQWQAAVGWFCSLSVMALLLGLAYVLREVPAQPSLWHALYQGLHRLLWAVAVAWVILACQQGYGGIVDRFLSLSVWAPLSGISFACYLIHPIVIILYNGRQETPLHYTDLNLFYLFLGHLVLTLVLGYLLTVLIEKPYLFRRARNR